MEGDREKKANLIFEKAMEHYNRQEYEEALKLFELSQKFFFNSRTEIFISVCKNNITSGDNNNNKNQKKTTSNTNTNNNYSNSNNNYQRSYSTPNNSNTSNNTNSSTNYTSKNSTESAGASSDDNICINLLKKKDYYDILGLSKNASQDEIKKAYKKQAIKFHPDKNHSNKAEECFKKVSEAYQTLSNPEKKQFYDKYGNEEEFRNRYYQTHQHHYEDDIDPFDIFEMFFNGGININGRHFRRGRRNNNENNNRNQNQPRGKFFALLQILPFILILLLSNLPDLFEYFKSPPLYQFYKDYNYSQKRKTSINNVEYYIGNSFIKKYPKLKNIIESGIEENIEKDYLNFITEQCQRVINKRKEYEYYVQLGYYRYKYALNNLDFSSCYKYNELKDKIR